MDYSQTPFGPSLQGRQGRNSACTVDTSFKTLNSSTSFNHNGLHTPPSSARDQRRYSAFSSLSPVVPSYASASTPFTPDLIHGPQSFDDSGYDSSYVSQEFSQDGKCLDHGSFSLPSGSEHQHLYGMEQIEYGRPVQAEVYDVPHHSTLTLNYVNDDRAYASQHFAHDGRWNLPPTLGCPAALSLATPLFESAQSIPMSSCSSSFDTPALTPSVSSTGVSSAELYNDFDFESTQLELPTAIVPSQAYTDQSFYDHSSPLSAVSEAKPFIDADDGAFLEHWAARTPYSNAAYSPIPERKILPSSRLSRRRAGPRSQARGGRPRPNRRQVKIEKFEDKIDEEGNTIGVDMTCLPIKRDARGELVLDSQGKFILEPDVSLKDKHKCPHVNEKGERCEKSFDRMEHLKRHENSHTGARPFRCVLAGHVSKCILDDEAASRNDNLGDHIATHIKAAICREKNIKSSSRNGPISIRDAQALILEEKTEAEAVKLMNSVTNKLQKVVKAHPREVTQADISFPYLLQLRH